jgi:hypothetical protein
MIVLFCQKLNNTKTKLWINEIFYTKLLFRADAAVMSHIWEYIIVEEGEEQR